MGIGQAPDVIRALNYFVSFQDCYKTKEPRLSSGLFLLTGFLLPEYKYDSGEK